MKKLIFASLLLLLTISVTSWAGEDFLSPDLPPDGEYISNELHMYSAMGIILIDPRHIPLVDTTIREYDGDDELETFDSIFEAVEIGLGIGPITLTGPVTTRVTDKALSTTGTFDTEIVSMSLSGNTPMGPIMIREDPQRASIGVTDILDLGGGLYHIDSFFDVFTELSVDGGQTWIASDSNTRMYLVPEPASICLMALGGLALMRKRK